MRGFGIERMKVGWSRVVWYVSTLGLWAMGSPTWAISARRALWSLYSVFSVVVMVGRGLEASFGMRNSQWSKGVFVGVYVGVSVFPKWVRCVSVRRSARGL